MSDNHTKQNIIEKAYGLFSEKGYDQVTVNDICQACEITKTTFYYHLKSKEEILSHFYDPVTHTLAGHMAGLLSAENYWEQLLFVFDTLLEEAKKLGPDLNSQLLIMNLREDRGSLDMREELTQIAGVLIEKAQKAGQIRNQSPVGPLYEAAAHAYTGYELMWCIKKGGFDRKLAVRKALECIFDADPEFRMKDNGHLQC